MKYLFIICSLLLSNAGFGQTFSEIIKSAAFDRAEEDRYGWSVDISGDYAIVGAYADDFGELNPNMGSAYIFEKTGIEDWSFVQKINNSDQDDYDRFGWSVAIDGNYAVIGAYGEDEDTDDASSLSKAGSAYIFERDETGTWIEVQKIVASDREEGDEFGWTVDISGTTIIVGAHHEDHDAFGEAFIFWSGSVYVFDQNDEGVWEETQKLVAWDRQPDSGGGDETMDVWHYTEIDYGDLFGCSLSLSGDFMIVGAHNGDYNPEGESGIDQAGAAYIFHRVDGTWEADEKVCAPIRQGWDRYGYSVAIDSNVAVVGAKAEDHSEFEAAFLNNAGSAYIFTRSIDGDWSTVQKIDASDRGVGDHFGIDVSIDGNYMVVGAESNNFDEFSEDELNNSGAAYIFEKDEDGIWDEIQKIDASDRNLEDWFANSIAISEHTIISGAWQQDFDDPESDSITDAGAAYFFSALLCETAFFEQEINLCAGETLEVGDHIYTESGVYIDTLSNIDACDSILTTSLTFYPLLENTQELIVCAGESVTVGESVYFESGVYEDILTAESGCDSTVYTTLEVLPLIENSQEFTICFGESITVGESIYSESGSYTDILTAENGCDSTVYTFIDVNPAIDVSVTLEETTLTGGDPDVETTTFQWIKCDPYEIIDGATDQTYTVEEDGDYAIIITDGMCNDTSECVTVAGVGIDAESLNGFTVYPNPNSGEFIIELKIFEENTEITIINTLGSVVYKTQLTAQKTTIVMKDLTAGIYLLQLKSNDAVKTKKIQVR